jgi:DNA polymerase-1
VLLTELAAWQRERILERELWPVLTEIELPLVHVLRSMERSGVRLNVQRLGAVAERVRTEIGTLEREIWDLAGTEFVIGSPQQLGEVLFNRLNLSKKRRGKTGFSTDARVLQAIRDEHEVIPKIERWRELNQLTKTYLDVLPQLVDGRGRIHTTFDQAIASTGRLSSTNPNMQNVPIRTAAGARDPRLLRGRRGPRPAQRRLLAGRAADPRPRRRRGRAQGHLQPRRGRPHRDRVAGVLQGPDELTPMDRSKAKMINYGIVYGLSDYGLAERLNIPREEAKTFIDAYLERFARSPRSWPRRSRAPRSTATSSRSSAGAGRSPSCGPATTRCARWASAWRSTRSSRARPPTCSSSRWSARTARWPSSR